MFLKMFGSIYSYLICIPIMLLRYFSHNKLLLKYKSKFDKFVHFLNQPNYDNISTVSSIKIITYIALFLEVNFTVLGKVIFELISKLF